MKRNTTLLSTSTFLLLLSCSLPVVCWPNPFRTIQHPLNWPEENAPLFEMLRNNPRIRTVSQVGFLGITLACVRLLNKSYTPNHLALKEALSPDKLLTSPLKCIDDGLIGHPGNGHQPPYGLLGTSWAWVPKIDQTFVAVDNNQRKMQAWTAWIQKNLRSLDNESPLENWWNQLRGMMN